MHLAAFVDDVAAADHRLTVHADDPPADLRASIADALPAAAVTVDAARSAAPGRLGRLDDGSLALRVGSADRLVVGPDLSLGRPTSNAARPLGTVDETTFTVEAGSRALIDAATRGVASLATGMDTLHLGLGQSVGEPSDLLSDPDGTLHVYGGADATAGTRGVATGPATAAAELEDARFAVVDAAKSTRAAGLLAVPDDTGYRGFLTTRTAIVDDLAGYLDRRYARGGSGEAKAPQT
jgi:hypothetical protein